MYDLIVKNCRIIDGTGAPYFYGDVAVASGKIAKVGIITENEESCCEQIVDGENLYLSPGFIDIHSHSDITIMDYPLAESRVFQGITTEIGGNCGMSIAPVSSDINRKRELESYLGKSNLDCKGFGDFLDAVREKGTSVNFGCMAGHGTLRIAVMGFENRKATDFEIDEMKCLLKDSLDSGAFGMSSGLIYPPGCYSDTEELVELCCVLTKYGGIYMTHMREEGRKVVDSTKEAIDICRRSKVALEISHHKIAYKGGWRKLCFETTKLIEDAIAEGIDVMCDQYPYCASSTSLDSNVPEWAFDGGVGAMFERLRNPETREILKQESNKSHIGRWGDIYVTGICSEKNRWMVGKSIEDIARKTSKDPADVCFDLILEESGQVDEINFGMCEDDVEYIMKKPYVVIGSDGSAVSFDYSGRPHPRFFGTFPRVLSHYCKARELFSLETAINKMTGLTAKRLGLHDRGFIKEGMWADFVLFDFDKIEDTPSFDNPKQQCKGVKKVYINGVLTVDNGMHTGARAGMVLRKEKVCNG